MVLPSVDNKSIKKTTEDTSPTESKLNIIDSDNFLSWIVMKKHTLLYCYALIVNIKYKKVEGEVRKNRDNTIKQMEEQAALLVRSSEQRSQELGCAKAEIAGMKE